MGLLSIAERELRVAARRRATYWSRFAAAAVTLTILAWVVYVGRFAAGMTHTLFLSLAHVAFIYAFFAGVISTGDAISSERREGTLGLLFLTNLRGYQIAFGKLLANSLGCTFGLLAMLPILAIPLLLGGVSPKEFGQTALSLGTTLLLSLGAGLLVSSFVSNPFRATSLALILLAIPTVMLPVLAIYLGREYNLVELRDRILLFSPYYNLQNAATARVWGGHKEFWSSLICINLVNLACFLAVSRALPLLWKDAPERRPFRGRWNPWRLGGRTMHSRLRQRLLGWNPFYWLAARERFASIGFLLFALLFTVLILSAARTLINRQTYVANGPSAYHYLILFWFWVPVNLHALLLLLIAFRAVRCFSLDRESGALDLILATPARIPTILAGQMTGLFRALWGPAAFVLLSHAIFIGVVIVAFVDEFAPRTNVTSAVTKLLNPFAPNPDGTPGELTMLLRNATAAMVVFVFHWIALAVVGMWHGLNAKRLRLAPWKTVLVVLAPPWIAFFLIIFVVVNSKLYQSEFQVFSFLGGTMVALSLAWDTWLIATSLHKLLRNFP